MCKIKCREAFELRRSRKGSKGGEEGRRITSRILENATVFKFVLKNTHSLSLSLSLSLSRVTWHELMVFSKSHALFNKLSKFKEHHPSKIM